MRSRILLALLSVAMLTSFGLAAPPTGGQMFGPAPQHAKGKKYTVWFKLPGDCRWRYNGTYTSRRAAEIAAMDVKLVYPDAQIRIDES